MSNAPLDADDELEKNILSIIEAHFKPSDNSLMPLNATKRVMQIALADRKKHELQAYSDGFRKASKGAFKAVQEAKREAVEAVLDKEHSVCCRK